MSRPPQRTPEERRAAAARAVRARTVRAAVRAGLADGTTTLAAALHAAFDQLALGFPSLRHPPSAP